MRLQAVTKPRIVLGTSCKSRGRRFDACYNTAATWRSTGNLSRGPPLALHSHGENFGFRVVRYLLRRPHHLSLDMNGCSITVSSLNTSSKLK